MCTVSNFFSYKTNLILPVQVNEKWCTRIRIHIMEGFIYTHWDASDAIPRR
ncbi:MAG: hypothetical protein ISS67_06980 [Desulfobacterales bacterium]|nr:hypothetical protein [Desulfobacterales bacterium]